MDILLILSFVLLIGSFNDKRITMMSIGIIAAATYVMPIVPGPSFSVDEITPVDMKHVRRNAPEDKAPRSGELKREYLYEYMSQDMTKPTK